jgi:2,3-diketo-5-methylthio-1-phosphopentane phosphatase
MSISERTLVLCDFDGTVSPMDVGNRLLNCFTGADWERIDRDYCAGRIGSQAAYRMIAPLVRGTRDDMLEYVLSVAALDRHFAEFHHICRQNSVELKIVSDGLDFYIEALLARYGLTGLEFFANRTVFQGEAVTFEFPGASDDCGRCGNCKRSILMRCRQAYGRIVYIGDGHSDVCPAKHADLVFAKAVLFEKCSGNGNPCVRFETFKDIIRSLQGRGILT